MKKFLLIIFMGAALLGLSTNASALTFLGSYDNSKYYIEMSSGITWDDANIAANDFQPPNSHLAVITSQEEQDALQGFLTNYSGEYWLGGYQSPHDSAPLEMWEWVTGETWDYTNWASGEPNDSHGGEFYLATWASQGWKWNDEAALGNISGYIVENPVPEPGTILLLGVGLLGIFGLKRKMKK